MTHVVLFHSALGLRPAVHQFAQALSAEGHTVTLPDLFDGNVFDVLSDGVAMRDKIGIPGLMERANAAVADLPTDVVYAGFSMGSGSAQALGLMRPGARGVILMHGAFPLEALGQTEWPTALPCQIHAATEDPWVDNAVVSDLRAFAPVNVFDYAGDKHLFADADSEDYVAEHAALMQQRVLAFLQTLGRRE